MPTVLCVGLTTLDVSYYGSELVLRGVKTQAAAATLATGGPAANAAIAAATLGVNVALCTAIGVDPFAGHITGELATHNVALLRATGEMATPISSVMIEPSGNRTVVSANGAGTVPEPPNDLDVTVASSDVVLVDGHYPTLAIAALTAARAQGVATAIDLGSWKPAHADLLPMCDFAIASADFRVPHQTDATDEGENTTATVLDYLCSCGVTFGAVTRGSDPIGWRDASGASGSLSVEQVDAVDTNGAGDILHGAFVAELARGSLPLQALILAAEIATGSCATRGARIPPELLDRLGVQR